MLLNLKINNSVTLVAILWLVAASNLLAQKPNADAEQGKRHAFLIPIGISTASPEGDLKASYGPFGIVNIGAFYKTKSNWLFGTDFTFFFGNQVKINPISALSINSNTMIGNDGYASTITRSFRGLYAPTLKIGKIFPMPIGKRADQNSGFALIGGAGYFAHKIRYADISRNIPLIQTDLVKGYDRLSTGLGLQETISYLYLSTNRRVNFTLALDLYQGFTQNKRVNYDLRGTLPEKRFDFIYALRLAWVLPVYGQRANEFYYY